MANIVTRKGEVVQDPPLAKFLFNDPRAGIVWLALRVWLGYTWVTSGLPKWSNPKWISGESLQAYWTNAVKIPETGKPPISFDWYRSFIQFMLDTQSYVWFAKLVMVGEMLVGIALILGMFTGVAALFGGFMNWNFMMAGSASTNPLLFVAAVALILSWKVAGYFGADYFLLKWIGTPWHTANDEKAPSRQAVPSPVAGD
jgi:thiosulfate dehydrogenase [quinone] large subunit